jgi:hypothetical protein
MVMTNPNDRTDRDNTADVHRANPDHAAVDPKSAAVQDQVKADHDALQESARRVESSVPSNMSDPRNAATDPRAAAIQDQVKADHDALQESARRVDASVNADRKPN